MKLLLIALTFVFVGCLTEFETSEDESFDESSPEESNEFVDDSFGHNSYYDSCGYQILELFLPDGAIATIKIPLECDQYYIEKGRPTDKHSHEELYNNPQQEQLVY